MPTHEQWTNEIAPRRAAVRSILESNHCDSALVFAAEGHNQNFRYLTNFTPVLGDMWAIIGPSDPIDCILNFTWQLDEARALPPGDRWSGAFDAVSSVVEALAAVGPARLGVDGFDRIPLRAVDAIRADLPKVEFVDVGAQVSALRRIKSPLEIGLLREAARIADAALDSMRTNLRAGLTENEISANLTVVAQSLGGSWAFPPCVQADLEDPAVIRMPTGKQIRDVDSVMIDIGVEFEGYQSDAARTFVIGTPNELQLRAWDTVRRAHEAALAVTGPGRRCRDIDVAGRAVIDDAGFSLRHRIGHGIGLATSFEWPSIDTEEALLEPGMTICLEPSIVQPGAGTMKIEDDILITDDGYELLTRSSYELELN